MLLRIRVDSTTNEHIVFSIFCDGAFAGKLKMTLDAYALFTFRLKTGTMVPADFTIDNAIGVPDA